MNVFEQQPAVTPAPAIAQAPVPAVAHPQVHVLVQPLGPPLAQPTAPPQQAGGHAPRVSARTNKGVPPRRFSPSTNAILLVLTLFYLFALAAGQDVILLQSYGAVAEKCGKVAIDEGPGFFRWCCDFIFRMKRRTCPSVFRTCIKTDSSSLITSCGCQRGWGHPAS